MSSQRGHVGATPSSIGTTWDADQHSLLDLSSIHVSRPIRAWERRPITAVRGARKRDIKIWKRAATPRSGKAFSVRDISVAGDRTKPVKRMCLSPETAVGTQFEIMQSPEKRIITRSAAIKDLIALDERQHGRGDTLSRPVHLESLDAEGLTRTSHELLIEDEQDWTDEEFDDTLMHLEDAVSYEPQPVESGTTAEVTAHAECPDNDNLFTADTATGVESDSRHVAVFECAPSYRLPAGFVSPDKRQCLTIKRVSAARRRRTLPTAFAPISGTATTIGKAHPTGPATTSRWVNADQKSRLATDSSRCDGEDGEQDLMKEAGTANKDKQDHGLQRMSQVLPLERGKSQSGVTHKPLAQAECLHELDTTEHQTTTPLRRSTRRKSSSPMKDKTYSTTQDKPHVVALTPVRKHRNKGLNTPRTSPTGATTSYQHISSDRVPQTPSPVQSTRNTTSAGRTEKQRLSDDSALLQAFLDREAEKKEAEARVTSSQSTSAIDSYIAAPASSSFTILQDMSPNVRSSQIRSPKASPVVQPMSPEEFKQLSRVVRIQKLAAQFADEAAEEEDEENEEEAILNAKSMSAASRRSSRIMATAPAKITLRGIKERVRQQRTAAQDLMWNTAKNTRANMFDAVMPKQRIPTLMSELLELSTITHQPVKSNKKKTVTWNKIAEVSQYFDPHIGGLHSIAGSGESRAEIHGLDLEAIGEIDDDTTKPRLQPRRTPTPSALELNMQMEPEESIFLDETAPSADNSDPPLDRKAVLEQKATPARKAVPKSRSGIATPIKRTTTRSTKPSALAAAPKVKSISKKTTLAAKRTTRLPAPIHNEPTGMSAVPAKEEPTTSMLMSPAKRRSSLFIPKLESDSATVDHYTAARDVPSMTSPAKKPPRRALVFGVGSENIEPKSSDVKPLKITPGLGSPAKKRAHRV